MKKFWYFLTILALVVLAFFLINRKPAIAPTLDTSGIPSPTQLCFAFITKPNERGFYDQYTLRLNLAGDKATGELNFLPGEKDSKVGKFTGTVSPVDKTMMARTADLWWDTFGEGIRATEEIKIIFGEGTASLGAGELVDRGDGVFVYKDPNNLKYTMSLTDIACADLTERENVEAYVRANIAKLSPVQPVLGGNWNVLSVNPDVAKNSGTVMYEDGHIQEKRNFTYTTDDQSAVTSLTIQ